MPGKWLTLEDKVRILDAYKNGNTMKEIAEEFRRSYSTIWRLLKRSRQLAPGMVPTFVASPGRPRKLTFGMLRILKLALIKNPFMTAGELKHRYPEYFNEISIRTIQRGCRVELGMPIRKSPKKPLLTARMRKQRLAFARKMKDYTPEQWEKVL